MIFSLFKKIKNNYYPIFNLLIKILVGGFVIYKIVTFFKDNSDIYLNTLIRLETINWYLFIPIFILMLTNYFFEAVKYRLIIAKVITISYLTSFRSVFIGNSFALASPNRIAEIPSRVLAFRDAKNKKKAILLSFINSFSQLSVTMFFGVIAYFFLFKTHSFDSVLFTNNVLFSIVLLIVLLSTILTFFYLKRKYILRSLKSNRIKVILLNYFSLSSLVYLKQFFFSLLRYFTFMLQFFFVLRFLDRFYVFDSYHFIVLSFYFLMYSIVPTFILVELGVRVALSYYLFSLVSTTPAFFVLAILTLWAVNVAIPALLGLFFVGKIKLI